mmetsp:Transcript_13002/g.30693  ORF Transcript_13002/g.30693 Transcript_13002/m.30693 type:complete len:88 (-) Transcript_13002:45-308(-)
MSMQQTTAPPSDKPADSPAPAPAPAPDTGATQDAAAAAAMSAALGNPDLLSDVLSTLPGVDPTDPRVRAVLDNIADDKDKEKKEEGK